VTWTQRTSGTGNDLIGVAYGNGLFVAVGDDGTILTSPDGVSWTQRTSGTGNLLEGVTYGNGLFVAVGKDGTILTSPDGVSWTAADLADEAIACGRDLRERPLRGGGGSRRHPHLPLNRRSPRPYPAPSPVGRGTLTRDPAGVGAPADLAGTRPLVVGAPPLHKSAPSQNGGPAPSAEGASGRPPPLDAGLL
jgi:hypothetical protein